MNFTLDKSIEILSRTPAVLEALLKNLPEHWHAVDEGENTFSAYDVVGHLIHGEKTDWMARAEIVLQNDSSQEFEPYDRFAQFENSKGKTLEMLLGEFARLREKNLIALKALNITDEDLEKKARHPHLGIVTLRELLATWTAHDLSHIGQITRVMAKHYSEDVGPWKEYLPILTGK